MPTEAERRRAGRGPGSLGRWYEVRLFNGEVFRGRYMEVDFTELDRIQHVLSFDLEDGDERNVLYGDLEAAIPLNPKIRKQRGLPT